MTVKEFAAFTGMSPSGIRGEIRAGRLQATMQEKGKNAAGKAVPAHYLISEDPRQWLKRRNPQTEESPQTTPASQNQETHHQNRQKSRQDPEIRTDWGAVLGLTVLGIVAAVALGMLFVESRQNY